MSYKSVDGGIRFDKILSRFSMVVAELRAKIGFSHIQNAPPGEPAAL
jgi:hypothetical protein